MTVTTSAARAPRSARTIRGLRLTLAAAATAAALMLSGCGGSGTQPGDAAAPSSQKPLAALHPASEPRSLEGPSTAVLPATAITPVPSHPTPQLPTTVTSHDPGGVSKSVTVKSDERIVAFDLAGSIAGAVYGLGLGSHLVGRDVATTFPPADRLPLVTAPDGQSVSAEAVLALKPTVVITDGTVGPTDVIQQLRESGIPVVFVQNTASFAGAQTLAQQVGAALGVPDAGAKLAARIGSEVAAEKAAIAKIAPRDPAKKLRMAFLYLRGQQGVYYLFGTGSGADALIDALGGIDVATEQGWSGMKPMTDEALVKMNPDLILVMTDGLKSVGGVDGLLAAKPAVALTNAGKHRRFVDMADGEILSFGPRSADILDALARAIYAPGPS